MYKKIAYHNYFPHNTLKYLWFIGLYMVCSAFIIAQCDPVKPVFNSSPFAQNINYSTPFLVPITVAGQFPNSIENNLSTNVQGVCGVDIVFENSSIKDLEILIESPAGQVLSLLGSAVPTFGVPIPNNYNISFVENGIVAMPMQGFNLPSVWDQNDPNLPFVFNLTGSYYPANNVDLKEYFNKGTVTGVWKVYVSDKTNDFNVHYLKSIGLKFCVEPTNLICTYCPPDSLQLSRQIIKSCALNPVPDFLITDYIMDYDNKSFYYHNAHSRINDPTIDVTILPQGKNKVFVVKSKDDISEDITDIFSATDISAELKKKQSSLCLTWDSLIIDNQQPTIDTLPARSICFGDTTWFDGKAIVQNGIYDSLSPDCSSRYTLAVEVINDFIEFQQDKIFLDCHSDTALLSINTSNDNNTIEWFYYSNPLINDVKSWIIKDTGIYVVKLTHNQCVWIDTVNVELSNHNKNIIPTVVQHINCNNLAGAVNFTTSGLDIIYYRRFDEPNFTMTKTINSLVSVPRDSFIYLYAKLYNGCNTDTVLVEIDRDTALHTPFLPNDTLDCTKSLKIDISDISPYYSDFGWKYNSTIYSTSKKINISQAGQYGLFYIQKNGCGGANFLNPKVFQISIDTTIEKLNISGDSSINCINTFSTLKIANSKAYESINWYDIRNSNSILSTVDSFKTNSERTLVIKATNERSCKTMDTINVIKNIERPKIRWDSISPKKICIFQPFTISNQLHTDNYTYTYINPDSTNGTFAQGSHLINMVGNYQFVVTDTHNHCIIPTTYRLDSIDFYLDYGLTKDSIYIENERCINDKNGKISINFPANSRLLASIDQLNFRDTSFINLPPSPYTIYVQNTDKCIKPLAEIAILPGKSPISINIPQVIMLNCSTKSATIKPNNSTAFRMLTWQFDNKSVSAESIFINDRKSIFLEAIDTNGCTSNQNIGVDLDTIAPSFRLSLDNQGGILCPGKVVRLNIDNILPTPANIEITINQNPVGQSPLGSLIYPIISGGKYNIIALNQLNFCSYTGQIDIKQPSITGQYSYNIQHETCKNLSDGEIDFQTKQALNFELSGTGTYQNIYQDLGPGIYHFVIYDSFQCSYPLDLAVLQGNDLQLSLGNDLFIEPFNPIVVSPQILNSLNRPLFYRWSSDRITISDTSSNILSDKYDSEYRSLLRLIVSDDKGCRISDSIIIYPLSLEPFYVPNIIKISSYNQNSEFKIALQDDKSVVQNLSIFDRWGNKVFERLGQFNPLDPLNIWNGLSPSGELVNQGVYIYSFDISFLYNGVTVDRKIAGSITVIY